MALFFYKVYLIILKLFITVDDDKIWCAQAMNLRRIDLNLLPVFEAIYVERSLTRASEVLNMTQPAVSNALARIRGHFDDALFVRAGRGVRPTPVADGLIGPTQAALDHLRGGLDQKSGFDPHLSNRTFNISSGDATLTSFAPQLVATLERIAPSVRLHWMQVPRAAVPLDLVAGRLDFAIDIPGLDLQHSELEQEPLTEDEYVCVMRRDHPLSTTKLTLESYLSCRHVTVSGRRRGRTLIEEAVRKQGHRLHVAIRMQNHMSAFEVVAASDCVVAAPRALAEAQPLCIKTLPFRPPKLAASLYRVTRSIEDSGLNWLRGEIISVTQGAPELGAQRKRQGRALQR